MRTSTASTLLPCTPGTFWAAFLDESLLHALYVDELQSRSFEVLELGDATRVLRIAPRMRVPAPVEKLIGESFTFEEHGTLDRAKDEWTWRMVQPANLDPKSKPRKDAVTMHGTVRIESTGPHQSRRTDRFTVEAKLFGLGGLIESSIEKELQRARAAEYAFLQRRLSE